MVFKSSGNGSHVRELWVLSQTPLLKFGAHAIGLTAFGVAGDSEPTPGMALQILFLPNLGSNVGICSTRGSEHGACFSRDAQSTLFLPASHDTQTMRSRRIRGQRFVVLGATKLNAKPAEQSTTVIYRCPEATIQTPEPETRTKHAKPKTPKEN